MVPLRRVLDTGALRALPARLLLLALLWWILAEGALESAGFGLVAVLLVGVATALLFPPSTPRLRWWRLPRFLIWFFARSLLAGLDVSRRLVQPVVPLRAGVLSVDLWLPPGAPRWWLANTLSLLPGTLSVVLQERGIEIHGLDLDQDLRGEVVRAQAQVARLYGVSREGRA